MAGAAPGTQPEFWSPPTPAVLDGPPVQESVSIMAEACPRCGSEFLPNSKFCHTCGGRRPVAVSPAAKADAAFVAALWERAVAGTQSLFRKLSFGQRKPPSWLAYLHFHEIQSRTGLSAGSLISFVIGLVCVAGALMVGLLTAKTLADWQAIQFYRAEWLLAATAAFVAGILLKKSSDQD